MVEAFLAAEGPQWLAIGLALIGAMGCGLITRAALQETDPNRFKRWATSTVAEVEEAFERHVAGVRTMAQAAEAALEQATEEKRKTAQLWARTRAAQSKMDAESPGQEEPESPETPPPNGAGEPTDDELFAHFSNSGLMVK